LCDTNLSKTKWLKIDSCRPLQLVALYKEKQSTYNPTCNTDKTADYTCDLKCRTRGIQIAATNFGFIMAFRELFLSESITQVAQMYLDMVDHYEGLL